MLISRLNRRIRKNPIKNGRRLAAIHCDGIETARDDGRRRRRRYGGDEGEKSETDDGARPYLSGTSVNAMISAAGARPVRGRCAAGARPSARPSARRPSKMVDADGARRMRVSFIACRVSSLFIRRSGMRADWPISICGACLPVFIEGTP